MGGRGSSMKGSQGMGGGAGAPAAAAQAMPTIQAAPTSTMTLLVTPLCMQARTALR